MVGLTRRIGGMVFGGGFGALAGFGVPLQLIDLIANATQSEAIGIVGVTTGLPLGLLFTAVGGAVGARLGWTLAGPERISVDMPSGFSEGRKAHVLQQSQSRSVFVALLIAVAALVVLDLMVQDTLGRILPLAFDSVLGVRASALSSPRGLLAARIATVVASAGIARGVFRLSKRQHLQAAINRTRSAAG